ncbi:MAG: hypothetical protein P4L38_06690 [Syntrophaceae bacterium]|nr:hypothetical protein [Syntrophaceae bacterium]
MAELEIKAGDEFFVPWPFSYVYINDENTLALVPGFASIDREDGVVIDMVYHVEGRSILTVIGVFKPPGYQTRILHPALPTPCRDRHRPAFRDQAAAHQNPILFQENAAPGLFAATPESLRKRNPGSHCRH